VDIHSHLLDRNLQPNDYYVYYDDEVACFLLFNLSGQVVGYHQYRPFASKSFNNNPKDSRYFTLCKDKIGVWGLETYFYDPSVIFLTEGIFDACRLHNFHLPAIAVLANNPKQLRPWLSTLPKQIIAICDGDKAGRMLANSADHAIMLEDGTDLGDLESVQIQRIIEPWLRPQKWK